MRVLGALGLGVLVSTLAMPGWAQNITLDGTVGPAGTLAGPVYEIKQGFGTTAEANLFHSFSEFGLTSGEEARFTSGAEIDNILVRVTGGTASSIDGLLSVTGSDANLFVMNPAGLLFGDNAQLNLAGSFVGTTASSIRFGELGEFSAVAPASPALLTISPSAFMFRGQPTDLISRSVALGGTSVSGRELFGLSVPDGKQLILLGGNVEIDGQGVGGGGLNAQGGRIELSGVEAGEVNLTVDDEISLSFPTDEIAFANVSLLENARVNARGDAGGDLIIHADRLLATNGGRLVTGPDGAGDGGNIVVNARDVELRGESANALGAGAENAVNNMATGRAGSIIFSGEKMNLSAGGEIASRSFGNGQAGSITLEFSEEITLDGSGSLVANSAFRGNASDINIRTKQLTVTNGAQISNSIFGTGSSGDIDVTANNILFEGSADCGDTCQISSGIITGIGAGAQGSLGEIRIFADSIQLLNRAGIDSIIRGEGDIGGIYINPSRSVELSGDSTILNQIQPGGGGEVGPTMIETQRLSLHRGGSINSTTRGIGDAGLINIEVEQLELSELESEDSFYSGSIDSQTTGQGNAGNILINARHVMLRNKGFISSGVLDLESDNISLIANGDGGDIEIYTDSIQLLDKSVIDVSSIAKGRAGAVKIVANDDVVLDSAQIVSFSFRPDVSRTLENSQLENLASSQGGNISIESNNLRLFQSVIQATTDGRENAGNISLRISEEVNIEGDESFLSTETVGLSGFGSGGGIDIKAALFLFQDGARVASSTSALGDAGNISIDAEKASFLNNSFVITATSFSGDAGDIDIKASTTNLDNNAILLAGSFSSGNAGDINLDVRDHLFLSNGSRYLLQQQILEMLGILILNLIISAFLMRRDLVLSMGYLVKSAVPEQVMLEIFYLKQNPYH